MICKITKCFPIAFILSFSTILASCEKIDCDGLNKIYQNGQLNIIVNEIPISYSRHNFYIKGTTVKSKQDTVYDEENRWLCQFYERIEKGDTLSKNHGESILSIHKRDTILTFEFECDGKSFK